MFFVAVILVFVAVGLSIICCNFMTFQINAFFCCFVYFHLFILTLSCCINMLTCVWVGVNCSGSQCWHGIVAALIVRHQQHPIPAPTIDCLYMYACVMCIVIHYMLLSCMLTHDLSPCLTAPLPINNNQIITADIFV